MIGVAWYAVQAYCNWLNDQLGLPRGTLRLPTDTLDQTYREVAKRLPNNPAVRFETVNGKQELILTPLDELEGYQLKAGQSVGCVLRTLVDPAGRPGIGA